MQGPILFTSQLFLRKLWECEFHQSEWGNQERWHGIREEGRTKEEEEESQERETQLHSRPWEQPQLQELREGLQKGCLNDRSRKKLRCAWNYGKDVYSAGGEFGDRLTIQRKLSKWKKHRQLSSPRKTKSILHDSSVHINVNLTKTSHILTVMRIELWRKEMQGRKEFKSDKY